MPTEIELKLSVDPSAANASLHHPAVKALRAGRMRTARVASSYYDTDDSLLAKVTASGLEWNYARRKVVRALREFRIRGVKTNLAFLENVLTHPTFAEGLGFLFSNVPPRPG